MSRVLVLLAALCFATTGTAQALGPAGIDPAAVGAARIVVGGGLLVAVAVVLALLGAGGAGIRWARGPVLAGAAGVAAYQVAFFAAVADTGVAVGTIVALGSAPTLSGLLEWALHGRRPSARWTAATALACAGVVLLASSGGGAGVSAAGVCLAVVAGGCYAVYTLSAKRLLDDGHAPESVMAVAFGLGGAALLPVLALSGPGWLAEPGGIGLALFLGVIPTALAYVLFARGLRGVAASEAATLTLAEPVTAAVLGVMLLGEDLGARGVTGGALVLAGLGLLALRPYRRAPRWVAVEA